MEIKSVTDEAFRPYGRVLELQIPDLLARLSDTPVPEDVVYVASAPELEACEEFSLIQDSVFGGQSVQVGYCNGNNRTLNAVEYHRCSEINIPYQGAVLLLGRQQDVERDFTYDTGCMEAFAVPAGCAVELYATTLHYAPCNLKEEGFQVAIILPRGTNEEPPRMEKQRGEDRLLMANNKWLIAHEESGLGAEGAFVGLKGENLTI
ncbi:MAG: DUF4867 family protein [Lachnospiraceae bacterium]|jgi:hypothetical protein|nr:DUF4867 family protein [Lachnospiraceae bacterium]MCI8997213.1 DUF4867 family protein [Lachnospiraceae bacterium]MCI9135663.1 DUF4867 family protein [Lachnospiraceae bacterium]